MFKGGLKISKVLIGAFFAVVFAYLIFQVIVALNVGVKTIRAQTETFIESVGGNALIIRDEQSLQYGASNCVLLKTNGEKIAADEGYAVQYASESDIESYREIEALNKRISKLEAIRTGGDDFSDLSSLNSKVYDILTLNLNGGSGALIESGAVAEAGDELEYLLLSRKYAIDGKDGIEQELSALVAQRDEMKSRLDMSSTLRTPVPGYYAVMSDGYESTLTMNGTDKLTPSRVDEIHKEARAADPIDTMGKIVTSHKWRTAFSIPTKDADTMKPGRMYKIRLDGVDGEIDAKLISMRTEGERTLLVLESSRNIADVILIRTAEAQLIKNEYVGYRIPKDALKIQDGQPGVFCMEGIQVRFKSVNILYTAENYYIAEADLTTNGGLFLNDNIIVNTKGLYDNMVIS